MSQDPQIKYHIDNGMYLSPSTFFPHVEFIFLRQLALKCLVDRIATNIFRKMVTTVVVELQMNRLLHNRTYYLLVLAH